MKLSDIKYERPNIDELRARAEELFKRFDEAETADEQLTVYNEYIAMSESISTQSSLAYIRFTLDTRDEFYSKEIDWMNETRPVLSEMSLNFRKKMLASKFRPELEKALSPIVFKNYEISMKSFDPIIAEDCVEESKLETEYKKLLSSAKIPFMGGEYNIPQLGKFKEGPDREIRKEAFCAQGKWMKENADKFDDIFDRMVKVRDRMAKKMGFKNYVELGYCRMRRNCYSPEDIAAFREQVLNDWVPFVCEMKKKQAEELGIDRIMLYDDGICLKDGNPTPIGTPEEIFENGRKMYKEMSPLTGEFIDFMLEHDLFDVIAREGKSGGGYCTDLPDYKMPFIFANFNGTYGDIDVLTHEAGHAIAAYKAMNGDLPVELQGYGMETAEVHSMSMEFFAWKWMELFFGERADDYRKMHFLNALSFIPYGTMVDYFQQCVYEKPEMTPAERKALWIELEGKFRPYMSSEGITYMEEGGRWQYQSHIYERPFYYIDYCLAQTVAFDFLIAMKKDYDDAFKRYDEFVTSAGSKYFTDLVKDAGFKTPFEQGALKDIIENVK